MQEEETDKGAELMLLVRDGDEKAFAELITLHQKTLLNFFLRLNVPYSDAEDLVQLTFLKLYRYRESYTRTAKFTTYLFLLARQIWVDEVRRRIKQNKVKDALKADVAFQESLPYKNPEFGLNDDLQKALSKLSDAHREVVVLGMLKELPYLEISKITGVPVGTVKSRMHHALKLLRGELEK